MILPSLFSFLKIVLSTGSSVFPYKFLRLFGLVLWKKNLGILIGTALNLYIALDGMVILATLILTIHEHSIYVHLFESSSISFISILKFSKYKSFISLVRFIPRYIVLFDWSVFLFSLSDSLLFLLFSHPVVSNSLWSRGLQHARLPCSSPFSKYCSNSCLLSQGYHPTISSSVIPFSSHLKSFPASGSFQMSQFFASGGQNILSKSYKTN